MQSKHSTSTDDRTVNQRGVEPACHVRERKTKIMSTIKTAAVASINEQRKFEAQDKARRVILAIDGSNHTISHMAEELSKLKAELAKLANDRYNVVEIVGALPDSVSAATVKETIAQLNKDEQDSVADRCTGLDASIRRLQSSLDTETANRAELRKKLSEIEVVEITAATIG